MGELIKKYFRIKPFYWSIYIREERDLFGFVKFIPSIYIYNLCYLGRIPICFFISHKCIVRIKSRLTNEEAYTVENFSYRYAARFLESQYAYIKAHAIISKGWALGFGKEEQS